MNFISEGFLSISARKINISERDSSTSKESTIKMLKIDDDSNKKMKKNITTVNFLPKNKVDVTNINFSQLENLPNEILLKIFHYMNPKIKELLLCGHVSRRIRSVAHDHSFWQNVNLFPKNAVPTGLLQMILEHGCRRLNTCSQTSGTLMLNQVSQLEFLNTAWNTDSRVITKLLGSCHKLEQLRLSNVIISHEMISNICQNGQTLKVLKLTHCRKFSECSFCRNNIDFFWTKEHWTNHIGMNWIQPIIDNCSELRVLDLMDTELSEESIEYVAKNVTPKLSKITIFGHPFQTKYDLVDNWRSYCQQKIKKFENRCNNLNGRLNTYHSSLGNNFCLSNIEDIMGNINQDGLENWRNIISTFRRFE